MPDFNKQYAANSYDLLVNAYGDKITSQVSEDDFYAKIQGDKDGSYRRNIYNLLQNHYGRFRLEYERDRVNVTGYNRQ